MKRQRSNSRLKKAITDVDFLLNHVRRTTPSKVQINSPIPTIRTLANSFPSVLAGLNQSKVDRKHQYHCHHVVNSFHHDRDERRTGSDSRIAHREYDRSHHFAARPIRKIAPKPIVVATKRSRKRGRTQRLEKGAPAERADKVREQTIRTAAIRNMGLHG